MSDPRPTLSAPASGVQVIAPGMRALTPAEGAHLDHARASLRSSGVDVTSAAALGALLHRSRTSWAASGASAPPQAMLLALGVGVGDLVVAGAPGARWALHQGADQPTPAVVSASGEDAALPLTDVRARWLTGCTPAWVSEYVASAAAHLLLGADPAQPDVAPTAPSAAYVPTAHAPSAHRESSPPAPAPSGPTGSVPTPRAAADDAPRTPADLPYPPSPAAQDLALGALEHALDAVLASGTAQPFALVDGGAAGGPQVRPFEGGAAQAQATARAWVRTSGAARAAVAWYGRIPSDAGDQPAVLVEASDARQPSLVVAHRYTPATPAGQGRPRPARAHGDPVVLGQGAPLL